MTFWDLSHGMPLPEHTQQAIEVNTEAPTAAYPETGLIEDIMHQL